MLILLITFKVNGEQSIFRIDTSLSLFASRHIMRKPTSKADPAAGDRPRTTRLPRGSKTAGGLVLFYFVGLERGSGQEETSRVPSPPHPRLPPPLAPQTLEAETVESLCGYRILGRSYAGPRFCYSSVLTPSQTTTTTMTTSHRLPGAALFPSLVLEELLPRSPHPLAVMSPAATSLGHPPQANPEPSGVLQHLQALSLRRYPAPASIPTRPPSPPPAPSPLPRPAARPSHLPHLQPRKTWLVQAAESARSWSRAAPG